MRKVLLSHPSHADTLAFLLFHYLIQLDAHSCRLAPKTFLTTDPQSLSLVTGTPFSVRRSESVNYCASLVVLSKQYPFLPSLIQSRTLSPLPLLLYPVRRNATSSRLRLHTTVRP
ncbi:hypothetical protein BDR03DRAFT_963367 [Suillus americanus]|nr:hypothetical protein BDR03DRAFT_963367 [Suillus americanus]